MDAGPILTIADVIATARPAYDGLVELAEDVEDEWSFVNELSGAWLARLEGVVEDRGPEPAPDGAREAVAALAAEAAAIDDPHRAIDWLSTFPQLLLAALGEPL